MQRSVTYSLASLKRQQSANKGTQRDLEMLIVFDNVAHNCVFYIAIRNETPR